jgi:hypothetical protein
LLLIGLLFDGAAVSFLCLFFLSARDCFDDDDEDEDAAGVFVVVDLELLDVATGTVIVE